MSGDGLFIVLGRFLEGFPGPFIALIPEDAWVRFTDRLTAAVERRTS